MKTSNIVPYEINNSDDNIIDIAFSKYGGYDNFNNNYKSEINIDNYKHYNIKFYKLIDIIESRMDDSLELSNNMIDLWKRRIHELEKEVTDSNDYDFVTVNFNCSKRILDIMLKIQQMLISHLQAKHIFIDHALTALEKAS